MKLVLTAALALALVPTAARGQATDGHLVGTVLDPAASGISGATVEVENVATGVRQSRVADAFGAYRFNNLPVGTYTLAVEADGFAPAVLSGIVVSLNRETTANLALELGTVVTEVEVTAASAQIDTTTSTVGSSFDARQSLYSPSSNLASGILNLSLQGAGVASSGGTGLGEGPAIGGQRPRNNNFMIEGVDNNNKNVTGSIIDVPNEAVAEFSLLQNQFGAEFGRSNGGQFNTVIKSGTNEVHGTLYEYFANRHLNAVDESNKRRGIVKNPRLDDNRLGGAIGGPILRNRLFFFANYERTVIGQASAPGRPFSSPTAEGFARLGRIPGLSPTNLDILERFVPEAPAADGSTTVSGVEIPTGVLPVNVPTYQNGRTRLGSVDYTGRGGDQLRFRYVDNAGDQINPSEVGDLPDFAIQSMNRRYLSKLSYFRTLSSKWFNETRLGFTRLSSSVPAGDFEFPGLDVFPNITIEQDLDIQIGPNPTSPQSGTQNTYQAVNNFTYFGGRHTVKFGVDVRRNISSSLFIQRQRGDYNYSTLERYLLDLSPDIQAERNTGGVLYSGDNTEFYGHASDAIKVRRGMTLTLGLRYEYKGIPAGGQTAGTQRALERARGADVRRSHCPEAELRAAGGPRLLPRQRGQDRVPGGIRDRLRLVFHESWRAAEAAAARKHIPHGPRPPRSRDSWRAGASGPTSGPRNWTRRPLAA